MKKLEKQKQKQKNTVKGQKLHIKGRRVKGIGNSALELPEFVLI